MKEINIEINFKVDYSLNTEERFALRKWLQLCVSELNSPSDELEYMFAKNFEAYGMNLKETFNKKSFLKFLTSQKQIENFKYFRMPNLSLKKKNERYFANGSLEILNDKMLLMEGEVELQIDKNIYDDFEILFWTFSPRLRISI